MSLEGGKATFAALQSRESVNPTADIDSSEFTATIKVAFEPKGGLNSDALRFLDMNQVLKITTLLSRFLVSRPL